MFCSMWLHIFLIGLLSSAVVVGVDGEQDATVASQSPLDLDPFEDDDCTEVPHAEVLLQLMHEMCDLLEQVLWSHGDAGETGVTAMDQGEAWRVFDAWSEGNFQNMIKLAGPVLGRPYCEPGKVSWMAAECLLVLRQGGKAGEKDALACAEALDEDLLAQMTPRAERFNTRLHLVLRSPWPALRLLDLLVRLHPERGVTRMGACKRHEKWDSSPDIFDWPWFKPMLLKAADSVTSDVQMLQLSPDDGPLSRQYKARWLRVHASPELRKAISFSDDVFESYREHHYKAGCHLGVISSYVLNMLLAHMRDIDGRLQRQAASVANLINLHAPFVYIVQSDWPVFRLLHLMSLLQRSPPKETWQGLPSDVRAQPDAAKVLCRNIEASLKDAPQTVYVTSAWGHLAKFTQVVLARWARLFGVDGTTGKTQPLVFLALDGEASRQCAAARSAGPRASKTIRCVEAPRRLGIEGAIAKYLTLAAITRKGITGVWLDLDVFVMSDPTPLIHTALEYDGVERDIAFAKHLGSDSLSPAIVAARGSAAATDILMRYAGWLRENPFLLDHQGWDQFLDNILGDYAGGFDYQGRNVTVKDDNGPKLSFLPKHGAPPANIKYGILGKEFSSGDGWLGSNTDELALFHFWGADEAQATLFDAFYSNDKSGVPPLAHSVLTHYRREPFFTPKLPAMIGRTVSSYENRGGGGKPLYLVSVSYAHGCCQQSLSKNRLQALKVGVDDARAYGFKDLSPAWAVKHREILSQKKGAGWWLWKPHLILRALKDPAVPWYRGVVLWVDAGNYLTADPRPLIESALQNSDVAALRLKWCIEADWTSGQSLELLNVSKRYAVTDRPQFGAYFLMFRKTELSIAFVKEWLRKSEEPKTLIGTVSEVDAPEDMEIPGFQKHQADQSVFSVLFKEHGFSAVSLEQGHKIVKLARWRE